MGKRLTIVHDGRQLFDGDVAEFTWSETEDGVAVKAAYQKQQKIGDLLSQLVQGSPTPMPNGT